MGASDSQYPDVILMADPDMSDIDRDIPPCEEIGVQVVGHENEDEIIESDPVWV
jgi:hypothetical protein